jgi:4,5-dihydroxyphthalate decarboxylase
MADRKLVTAIQTFGHTQALKDGTVRPRSFDFEFEEVPIIIQAFRRMVRGYEFDISEMAITTYMCAKSYGKQFTALPIFLVRAFHHGAILVNAKAGIATPKDLEGKTVGVNRGYTVTTGVWARQILQHQYGVDLNKITWALSGDEHVEEYRAPANVKSIEKGKKMEDMLVSGELVAAIGAVVDHPDVKPLIPDAEAAGFEALRTHGHYPINHTLVVKDELLAAQPGLARDIFDAFVESKKLWLEKLRAGAIAAPTKTDRLYAEVMAITGSDPLPYGVEPNRKTIETLIQAAGEQGILDKPMGVDELFAAGVRDAVG